MVPFPPIALLVFAFYLKRSFRSSRGLCSFQEIYGKRLVFFSWRVFLSLMCASFSSLMGRFFNHSFSPMSNLKESCWVAKGILASIVPFTMSFYGAHSSFYYQHGWHVEGVTIIESSSSTRHGDTLGGPLFALAHYWTFLKTIVQTSNCIFPSLLNNTHIIRPINEIIHAIDHLLT
jgi:hypothetical protein